MRRTAVRAIRLHPPHAYIHHPHPHHLTSSYRFITHLIRSRTHHPSTRPQLSIPTPSSSRSLLHRQAHISVGQKESDALPTLIDLPSYITPPALASLLNLTLRRLAKDARHNFPSWWPQSITERRMLRTGYSNVKSLILSYTEAAQIARLYNRQPQLHIMEGTDLDPSPTPHLVQRSPTLAILGHKDHGKTTLLDSLRGTHIADKEEFGITQETYTFQVELDELTTDTERQLSSTPKGRRRAFTFLDTPGHHSFTEMRAQAVAHADIVVLVVAADEGLLDQSFESLNIITQFSVPVLIVITKVAKPGAQVERVRRELKRLGARLLSADEPTVSVKGEMVAVEVSVKEGLGLDVLRRALFGVTDLLDLRSDAHGMCEARVVEGWREEKGRGDVVRLIVRQGTLKVGDWFVSDLAGGRVKAMRNSRREDVNECGPGGVCEVMGFDALPAPGSDFFVCSKTASEAIREVRRLEVAYPEQDRFTKKQRKEVEQGKKDEEEKEEEVVPRSRRGPAPSFFAGPKPTDRLPERSLPAPVASLIESDDYDPLPVILKATSVGQLRMLLDSVDKINADLKIPLILVVESSVGSVTKTDIQYAQAYECPIYCFRVNPPLEREQAAIRKLNIAVLYYAHFQQLIDQITVNMQRQYDDRKKKAAMEQTSVKPAKIRQAQ